MFGLTAPAEADLDRLRVVAAASDLTYPSAGDTLSGTAPDGWHRIRETLEAPGADWPAARRAIASWAGHRAMRGRFSPAEPPIEAGTTMAFAIRWLGVWAQGTCRIIGVIDTHDTYGFAYGTLPHHPERGEEVFLARRMLTGGVLFEVASFSRPQHWLLRLAGPVGRLIQRLTARRYLQAFVDASS